MRIFVGITSYNTREYLQHCLRTMFRQQTKPSRVHIVDNCSSDGTQEFVSCLAEVNPVITCEFCDNNTLTKAHGAPRTASWMKGTATSSFT